MIRPTETRAEIAYVVENMRELDRDEVMATLRHPDQMRVIPSYISDCATKCWTATWHGQPVAIFGVVSLWPGVGQLFCFGTDDWGHGLYSMTKFLKKRIIPEMEALGLHRTECKAKRDRGDVARWLTGLGAECEGTLKHYGNDKSDFTVYAWTLPDASTPQH